MEMKKIAMLLMLCSLFVGTACGSDVDSVKKTDEDAPARSETESEAEEEELEQEEILYGIGDRIVFENKYALTIVGVTETKDRNEFSEKEVQQVLIIEYLYENLASEEEIYISEMEFKLVDEGGNMMDTYPVEAVHSPEYTPKGAKTLASFAVGAEAASGSIDVHYYDNFFSSEADARFLLNVGEKLTVDLLGEAPSYADTFRMGDIIEVSTSDGEYTLTIESVRKTDERNEYEKRMPEAVYEITYSYSNISMDSPLYIDEYAFILIDGHGNTGYSYPVFSDIYPQETVKGARSRAVIYLAAHKDSEHIILCYKDNMFNNMSDFYIELDGIQ